jgi:hypothetical protein
MQKQPNLLDLETLSQPLKQKLERETSLLWSEGTKKVPNLEPNDNILKALAFARRCGNLRVGLEQIQTLLHAEEAGLPEKTNKKAKTDSELLPESLSRLMFLSNDGSERFYRHCETTLNRYSHRLLGIKLNVTSLELGQLFYGEKDKAVKAVLVNKKESVLRVLSSFLE